MAGLKLTKYGKKMLKNAPPVTPKTSETKVSSDLAMIDRLNKRAMRLSKLKKVR